MSSPSFCVFKCGNNSSKILKFTEQSLNKFRQKLRIRMALNINDNDIMLPDCVDDVHGYHSDCRKKFMEIKHEFVEKFEKNETNTIKGLVLRAWTLLVCTFVCLSLTIFISFYLSLLTMWGLFGDVGEAQIRQWIISIAEGSCYILIGSLLAITGICCWFFIETQRYKRARPSTICEKV